MALKYSNLYDYWQQGVEEQPPKGYLPIKPKLGMPGTYMSPENMTSLARAFSPSELFTNPQTAPIPMDYPTRALNLQNRGKSGIPNAIVMASREPQSRLSGITSDYSSEYPDIPQQFHQYIPQAIYEHEVAHFQDPRMNPAANNYGYLKRFGLPGNIAGRELPAMIKESRFWDKLLGRY